MDVHNSILVVDLDGTLLRSDMLLESFWSALSRDWRSAFFAALALVRGRANLKSYLVQTSKVEVETLPYDPIITNLIKDWRINGGRTALVTASDQLYGQSIALHLGIFDEVHGSSNGINLKGEQKGRFLEERFGNKGFTYVGDANADLAVWKRAAKAITVNASDSLRRKTEKVCDSVEHLVTKTHSARSYVEALRPHQWLKNTLVFLPMLAAHQFDTHTILLSLLSFVCFSLMASCVYVFNDLLDLSADRGHPRKKNRPFASGSIPIAHGTWMALGLVLFATVLAFSLSVEYLMVMVIYLMLTTAYSLHLKRRIIIDICVLAGLYTSRIVAGGVATDIPLSVWLLAFSVFFFLSLAAVKRQAELVESAQRDSLKANGRGYHVQDLPIISMIALGAGYVSVLVLTLYISSPVVVELYKHPNALWGVCAVLLYWITRTVMVAHRGLMHDDPVVYAVKDRISQMCLLIVLVFIIGGAMA